MAIEVATRADGHMNQDDFGSEEVDIAVAGSSAGRDLTLESDSVDLLLGDHASKCQETISSSDNRCLSSRFAGNGCLYCF
jgi:hypothetical protein